MNDAVFAADLGGGTFRAALFDPEGRRLAAAQRPVAFALGPDGAAEADAEGWVATLEALAGDLFATAPAARTTALALTAFARSEVLTDAEGRALRPAFTFRDARAAAEAAALDALVGGRGAVTAFHPLARLAWVRAREPAIFARTVRVLAAKDFLNLRLTGRAAGDAVSHAPLLGPGGRLASRPFAAAGIDRRLLPAFARPRAALGRVRAGLPGALGRLAGARVAVSAMDTWCATLGLGAHRTGLAYNLSGTSEVNGLMLARAARARGLIGVAWDDGIFHLGGPSQAGADCLAWLAGVCGGDVATLAAEAVTVDPASEIPLFLPYLAGERVPFWDPTLRGGFVGLARFHGRGALARAVMEGVAFHDRVVFERASAAAGSPPAAVIVGGGGAASDLWCAIKADAWGLELRRPALDEPGLRGAYLIARGLLGIAGDPPPPPVESFRPDPARRAALDGRYRAFLAALRARGNRP